VFWGPLSANGRGDVFNAKSTQMTHSAPHGKLRFEGTAPRLTDLILDIYGTMALHRIEPPANKNRPSFLRIYLMKSM